MKKDIDLGRIADDNWGKTKDGSGWRVGNTWQLGAGKW